MSASEVDETDGLDQEMTPPAEIRLEINRKQWLLSVGDFALSFDDWRGAKQAFGADRVQDLNRGTT